LKFHFLEWEKKREKERKKRQLCYKHPWMCLKKKKSLMLKTPFSGSPHVSPAVRESKKGTAKERERERERKPLLEKLRRESERK